MSKFRGFIAIEIEPFQKLILFENDIKHSGAQVKLVEPHNIHITLKFLGDTMESLIDEIEKIIKNTVKHIKPFKIKLSGSGVFPNENYIKVVWIGIRDKGIIGEIAGKIDQDLTKFGFKKEQRRFSPHLTIARIKTVKNKEKLLKTVNNYSDIEFKEIEINSIKLKKSELTPKGPIYTTLRDIFII
jgi:2'-5' RNA ligase